MATKNKFQIGSITFISLAHLAQDVYGAFLAPILPLLIAKHGITLALAGLLSVFQRVPSMFNFVVGMFAERVRARYFIILTPAITAIAMSLLGLAPNYLSLAALLVVAGTSSAFFHVPTPVMIRKVAGDRIGLGMSLYMVGGELARSLGPIMVIWAVEHWTLGGMYKLMPFGLAASLVLFFRFRNMEISSSFKKEDGEKISISYWDTFKSFGSVFVIIGGITFFRAFMKSALTFYLPTYLSENGSSLWLAGIALAVVQFSGVLGTFASGTISDKIGRRTTLLIATIISPMLMWLFMHVNSNWQFPVLILIGLFLFATGPVFLAVVNELKTEYHSFINGVYMTINLVLGSISIVLMGFLSDHFGMEIIYKISAFVALIAIPFAFKIPKKLKE